MSPSAVSQQVRQLEREGGVTLLHRSTRKLALTEAGQRYHAQCAAMCAAAEQARAELAAARDAPSGELRMSATVGFARHVSPALGFGRLADSTWAARRLGALEWWLCASPEYLDRHGNPETPDALLAHGWLGLAREGAGLLLDLRGPEGAARSLRVEPRIVSNNQLSIQQMCEAGLGVALMGSLDVQDALASGRLVRLLPQWTMGTLDIWAVTPQRDAQPAKVRQAIAALQRYLVTQPGGLD